MGANRRPAVNPIAMIQKEITMSYGIMKMPKYLPQTGLFGLFVAGMAVLCCTLWNTAPASVIRLIA